MDDGGVVQKAQRLRTEPSEPVNIASTGRRNLPLLGVGSCVRGTVKLQRKRQPLEISGSSINEMNRSMPIDSKLSLDRAA